MEFAACGRVAAKPLARMSPVERKQWQHRGSQSVCRTCAEKAAQSRQSLDQLLERTSSAASIEVTPPPPPPRRARDHRSALPGYEKIILWLCLMTLYTL